MRFTQLRLQNFRNIEFAELDLDAKRIFLLGLNGQGKSNLLEALGLTTALRSFRTQDLSALPRQGSDAYAVVFGLNHERHGAMELELQVANGRRTLQVDGERVTRMGNFIGRFPVVPLSSSDLMLLRGSPGERRRFMDMTFSSLSGDYYEALRMYHKGIADRNRLLKQGGSDAELEAFESEVAPHASRLHSERDLGMDALRVVLGQVYSDLADGNEGPALSYVPNGAQPTPQAYQEMWAAQRARDRAIGATQKGPHRDDFKLDLQIGAAKEYGSDGQQRGLMVALRVAQAQLFLERLSIAPVLLVDDVLGELDPKRRAGFWKACPESFQVIASGTTLPDDRDNWKFYRVSEGSFSLGEH